MTTEILDQPHRRVLITGSQGMLGRAFAQQLALHLPQVEVLALSKSDWDVRDSGRVGELAHWVGAGWILHCAALVDVERCAREPDLAREIIVGGTANVAHIAAAAGAKIVYPQSFLIYDGTENPITEQTIPNPQALYAALKLAAEALILGQSTGNLSIRMAGFFGGEEKDKNFVGKIVPHIHGLILAGTRSFAVGDRVWQPTDTQDLARNALLMASRGGRGVYTMASHGQASFWDLTMAIVDELGWRGRIEITKTASENVAKSELGRRPARAVIFNQRLQTEELDWQRPWQESLHDYLASEYFKPFRIEPNP